MPYIDYQVAVELHDFVIQKTGGLMGIRSKNLLDSPLVAIQNDEYYPTLERKLAFLMFSIVSNHPFTDGNKRGAVAICAAFLMVNNYDAESISRFIMVSQFIVVSIATGKTSIEEMEEFFKVWQRLAKLSKI